MKGKIKKEYLRKTRKLLETKLYSRKPIKRINNPGCPLRKILGTILKMDQRRPQTNGLENKKTNDHA